MQSFFGDAIENFQVSVARALRVGSRRNVFAQIVEARPSCPVRCIGGRAAMASSRVSPATKRRAIRRVARIGSDPMSKTRLSESLRRIERSMELIMPRPR